MTRIWHPWQLWECYPAGLYETTHPLGDAARHEYAKFLRDLARFDAAISKVFVGWRHSCEHFLTNEKINRVAWIGQASMCADSGIPAKYRAGFKLLTDAEQSAANACAQRRLDEWIGHHVANQV